MTSPRTFLRCSLITCVVSVYCYAAADGRPVLALAATLAAFVSAWMMRDGLLRTLPRIAINLMVLAATGNVFLRMISLRGDTGSVISDLTDFLVFILMVKMFDRGRARDEAQLLGLSVFVVIGAILSGSTLLTGLTLLLYTPLAVSSVVLFQIYAGVQRTAERALLHAPPPGTPAPPGAAQVSPDPIIAPTGPWRMARILLPTQRARRDLIATTLVALLMSLAAAVAGFVFTPRTLSDQVFNRVGPRSTETGFRDNITLGQAGGISVSTEPVMDVILTDGGGAIIADRTEPLYMRGAVLDDYDPSDGSWRARPQTTDRVISNKDTPVKVSGGEAGRATLVQHVTVRDSVGAGLSQLFSLWRPSRVTLDETGTVIVSLHDDAILQRSERSARRFGYTVESSTDATETRPPKPLPPFENPRIRALAEEILTKAAVPIDPRQRDTGLNRRAASTVVDYLRTNCTYTLEMLAPDSGEDPIEMFLFRTRQGHCEYFASAMTGLLRSIDLDARIVTGYAGGEFNPVNNQYIIRKADAHAWVEVRLRADRWETFDPTPPGALGIALRQASWGASFFSRIRHVYEAFELQWVDSVVLFNRAPRINLAQAAEDHRQRVEMIQGWFDNLSERIADFLPGKNRTAGVAVAALILLAVIGAFVAAGRTIWRILRDRARLQPVDAGPVAGPRIRFYELMLKRLKAAGIPKPAHRPPLLHARFIAADRPAAASIAEELTWSYYRRRFGGAGESVNSAELLNRLRAALANKPD